MYLILLHKVLANLLGYGVHVPHGYLMSLLLRNIQDRLKYSPSNFKQ